MKYMQRGRSIGGACRGKVRDPVKPIATSTLFCTLVIILEEIKYEKFKNTEVVEIKARAADSFRLSNWTRNAN